MIQPPAQNSNFQPVAPEPAPAPVAPPPVAPLSSNPAITPRPRRGGSRAIVKILIVVIVLALIAGGAAFAINYFDPEWNPLRPSPDKVVDEMIQKSQTIKSLHSEMEVNADFSLPSSENTKLALSSSMDSDVTDLSNPKSAGIVSISVSGVNYQESFSANLETKVIGKDMYIKIADLAAPLLDPFLVEQKIDISKIKGVWIKIPQNPQVATSDYSAMTAKMQDIFSKNKIYNFKKQLPDQAIDGQKVYHYLFVLDNEKFANMISDLIAEAVAQTNQGDATLAAGIVEGTMSVILDKIGEIDIELSIGKNNRLLYGFKLQKSVDLSSWFASSLLAGNADIVISINSSKFNQPVSVDAPADFKNFGDVIKDAAPDIYKEMQKSGALTPQGEFNFTPGQ